VTEWSGRVESGHGSPEALRLYAAAAKEPTVEAFGACREKARVYGDLWGEAACLWGVPDLVADLDPDPAILFYRQALEIVESLGGHETGAAGGVLHAVGRRLLREDRAKEAVPWLEQALAVRTRLYGPDHVAVASSVSDLGDARTRLGEYAVARPLLEQAIRILDRRSPDSESMASALTNMAVYYNDVDDSLSGRPYAERALDVCEKLYPRDDPRMAPALNNLATTYAQLGDYAAARPFFERLVSVLEKAPSRALVVVLSNLATLEDEEAHDLARAQALLERALEVDRTLAKEPSSGPPFVLSNLGEVLARRGDLDRAFAYAEESLRVFEARKGKQHPDTADQRARVGLLELERGRPAQSRAALSRALEVQERTLGPKSHEIARTHYWIGVERTLSRDYATARRHLERGVALDRLFLDRALAVGSEREQRLVLDRPIGPGGGMWLAAREGSEDSARWALGLALGWKGRALDALSLRREAALEKASPADVAEVKEARQALARAVLDGEAADEVAAAQTRLDAIEKRLALRTGAAEAPPPVTDVCAALPPESALVELVTFKQWRPRPAPDEPRMLALVLRRAGPPARCVTTAVDLGPSDAIENAVRRWREQIAGAEARYARALAPDEAALAEAGLSLRRLAWTPVENALGGATRVYLAPDGALHSVAFAALPGARAPYLVEEVTLAMLTTGRDLLRARSGGNGSSTRGASGEPRIKGTLAIGAPDFDGQSGSRWAVSPSFEVALRAPPKGCLAFVRARWDPLPETAEELRMVAAGGAARVLTGGEATVEAVLSGGRGHAVVHIATHGYFADAACLPSSNPLTRSGLVLAGANRGAGGYLTALQVSGADYSGVELVTLSACETGLGEIRDGEGVFGLTRAFLLAGADGVVLSLFRVPSRETVDLMSRFYTARRTSPTNADALREAQLAMLQARRERKESTHPFFWGAFQAVGGR
jgi:CHAT domain-containing protein